MLHDLRGSGHRPRLSLARGATTRFGRMLAVVSSTLAIAIAAAAPAGAQSSFPGALPDLGSVGSGSADSGSLDLGSLGAGEAELDEVGDGSPEALADYWTPARMESAKAKDVEIPVDQVPPVAPNLPASEPEVRREGQVAPTQITSAARPIPQVGKVFFTQGGGDYVCSASSVSAANRNLVATAGHCLLSRGQLSSRFIFVPAYDRGNAPYGRFSGQRASVPPSWSSREDPVGDTAFVRVAPLQRSLADTVGSFSVSFNAPRNIAHKAYGYPAEPPFNGQSLYTCEGPNYPSGQALGIQNCIMNGGASGGPWLSNGAQNSVNSFIYRGRPGIYGPYWGTEIMQTYQRAQG